MPTTVTGDLFINLTTKNKVTITPYGYGVSWRQSGGWQFDQRLELFLGTAGNPQPPEFSVRHNGNNLGARIQARNAADTDGMLLDFLDPDHPQVRFGNVGPYLVKEAPGHLAMRHPDNANEVQTFEVAGFVKAKFMSSEIATMETVVPDHTITLYDADGNAFKVPCKKV
jgi:hypothetical protein